MSRRTPASTVAALLAAGTLLALPRHLLGQVTTNPLPAPINQTDGIIVVDVVEFASIPNFDTLPARPMLIVDEPGTRRMFVNDMRGPIYSGSYDGRTAREYVNINDPRRGVNVQAQGRERGMRSFAFHPHFGQQGSPGYGRLYTRTDTQNNLRFGLGPNEQIFLLNKADGTIRLLVPQGREE